MDRMKGRTAVVTGATSGIGRAAALYLASDESGWITGASLTIDGGIMTGA